MNYKNIQLNILHQLIIVVFSVTTLFGQGSYYWIGGPGNWNDPNHWSKNSGGSPVGGIPNANINAIFNNNSGLINGSVVTIPPGTFSVYDLNVQTSAQIEIRFNSSSINAVNMEVNGDLILTSGMSINYVDNSVFRNSWKFLGGNVHNIRTAGKDLLNVQFLSAIDTYNQFDPLLASGRIRMYGGTWNSNNYDVTTAYLLFQDSNPSNNPLPKLFNAGVSNIYCEEWFSRLTYNSLEVTGNHVIYANKFAGSSGNSINFFTYNEIHLLEFPDMQPSGTSAIEHNNFECTYCEVQNLIIEDTGDTRLAGRFTVNGTLEVVNQGSTIKFNGGNGRLNEVVINGTVVTPVAGTCQERTIFTNDFNDFTTFTKSSGSLTIANAIIEDIKTSGGSTFNLSSGLLLGASTGWNLINPATPKNYEWNGPAGGIGNWDDPAKWIETTLGISNGCIPSIFDNVLISTSSDGDIRIPYAFTAQCRDFIWENTSGLELILDGLVNSSSKLTISGSIDLHKSATITPLNSHEIIFQSADLKTIETNSVLLPNTRFKGSLAEWHLLDKLACTQVIFESGTFDTKNNALFTDYWSSIGSNPKNLIFNASNIVVGGEFALSRLPQDNVTVNAGTSLIECDKLTSANLNLYDVQLNNTVTRNLDNYPYNFNSLILNSTNLVTTQNTLTVKDLIFNVSGSTLAIDDQDGLFITGGIESSASSTNPAILKSKLSGTRAEVGKTPGNICVIGHVAFQDIDADMLGVFNAPFGQDNGNNDGINYDRGLTSPELYWIGGSGDWHVESNWSRVSGGCPSTKSPTNAIRVVFDRYSFPTNTEIVNVPLTSTTKSIHFRNTNYYADFDITTSLTADTILVDGGVTKFSGKNLFVNESFVLNSGISVLNTLFVRTYSIKTSGGIVLVRDGTIVNVLD